MTPPDLNAAVERALTQLLAAPKDQQRAWQAVFLEAVRRRNEQRSAGEVRRIERERGLL